MTAYTSDLVTTNKHARSLIGSRIGRRLLPSKTRPEPVYELRWSDADRYQQAGADVNAMLEVTLRRVSSDAMPTDADDCAASTEYLEIAAVKGSYDNRPVGRNDVELRLCTLDSNEYWMDACIFHSERPEGLRDEE